MRRILCLWSSLALVVLFLGPGTNAQQNGTAPASSAPAPVRENEDAFGDEEASDLPEPLHRAAIRPSPFRKHAEAGFTPEEKEVIADKCKFGMPRPQTGAGLGPIKVVIRDGYVLGHSSADRIPYWVCEHATKAQLSGNLPRKDDNKADPFKADPKLEGFPRAELADYRGSGYDRGHMAPAGDQTTSRRLKNETFFLSNMVPQIGPTFNRGIWAQLEEAVRDWTTDRGESWIITGPLFYDPLEEDESTADGLIPYYTIGDDAVAVPTHCYKVVFSKKDEDWQSIAFVLENKKHAKPFRLNVYIVPVKWIEDRAGLDFFPELPDNPQNHELRAKLETKKAHMWNGE